MNKEAPCPIQEARLEGLHTQYKDPQLYQSSCISRPGTEEVEHPASWSSGGEMAGQWQDDRWYYIALVRERGQQTSGGSCIVCPHKGDVELRGLPPRNACCVQGFSTVPVIYQSLLPMTH